ncbi:MAG TPA: acetyl-CoA carboxylase carboxyltransferase subunit alpha [Gammaproteobacteria bacterium]|nr:acetyl-CoA carboxylase carboxyltransferase subunit alpha [Gammaproteobacteria bacterium]
MNLNYLDFEQPIAELESKIEELRMVTSDGGVNISEEIKKLKLKNHELTKKIFADLSDWQVVKLARHPQRPHTPDYIEHIFTDFEELHGDRHFSDDEAIIGGMARLNDQAVMIIGHQKGRNTKDNLRCNFGMPRPEGYRKALRLMKLAEKFSLPVITFINTPGAYPGIDAEERNQSEAIARNLFEMSTLKTPIISIVIGEGGSGGALAIGVADRVYMLQYSIYSVISPEGCASILWKSAEKAEEAAKAMQVTAAHIKEHGLIDEIIKEPLGGAHRDLTAMTKSVKTVLERTLAELKKLPLEKLLSQRYKRYMAIGRE